MPPATQQAPPLPTENEVAEYLLLLGETAGPEGESAHPEDFDLEEKHNPVPDGSTAEVAMDGEEDSSDKTLVVTTGLIESSAHEAQDMEEDADVLDNEEGDEPLEEFFYEPVKITEGVRRCNRSNGKGWFCRKLAHPGYAMCWDHVMNRRKYLQKRLYPNELQASTGRSEAVDWEETSDPSSPEALSSSPTVPEDDVKPA
ncbi:uncharacterized protein [Triticum aestivum]|uniref:uncharacterized protein n=1 Tax=Triticum aestivum TaxID=4565 RepID=UPI001D01EDB6|nr:uncharacterized protein LOC123120843 [Triticum aestivum]